MILEACLDRIEVMDFHETKEVCDVLIKIISDFISIYISLSLPLSFSGKGGEVYSVSCRTRVRRRSLFLSLCLSLSHTHLSISLSLLFFSLSLNRISLYLSFLFLAMFQLEVDGVVILYTGEISLSGSASPFSLSLFQATIQWKRIDISTLQRFQS